MEPAVTCGPRPLKALALVANSNEPASNVDGMATHCVPSQPTMVNLEKSPPVIAGMGVLASQVRVILAGVAPSMSQYSTLSTVPTLAALDVVGKAGPPPGKIP